MLETDAKLARGVLTRGRRCMPARTRLGEAVPCDTSSSPVPSGAAHQARWRRQAPRIHAQQRARTCRRERRDLDVTAARRAACREATAMVAAVVARSPAHARKFSPLVLASKLRSRALPLVLASKLRIRVCQLRDGEC